MREQPISAGLPGFSTRTSTDTTSDHADGEEAELLKLVRSFATTNIIALFPPWRSVQRNAQSSISSGEKSVS